MPARHRFARGPVDPRSTQARIVRRDGKQPVVKALVGRNLDAVDYYAHRDPGCQRPRCANRYQDPGLPPWTRRLSKGAIKSVTDGVKDAANDVRDDAKAATSAVGDAATKVESVADGDRCHQRCGRCQMLASPLDPNNKPEDKAFSIGDTPLTLNASPDVQATGTITAHLIPCLNLGVSALGNKAKAEVFLALDTNAALTMNLDGAADETTVKNVPIDNSAAAGNSTDETTDDGTTDDTTADDETATDRSSVTVKRTYTRHVPRAPLPLGTRALLSCPIGGSRSKGPLTKGTVKSSSIKSTTR
ncbi:hypothetical protein FB451DRAFT_1396935 [Mycena latifolia]|nr:hypothetical protein FB451DRAFT_1396935 [Mycena latifolia]